MAPSLLLLGAFFYMLEVYPYELTLPACMLCEVLALFVLARQNPARGLTKAVVFGEATLALLILVGAALRLFGIRITELVGRS